MNIATLSDMHLGKRIFRKNTNNINSMEYEIYNQWIRCIDDIIKYKPDLFLIAGDLFDKSDPTTITIDKAIEGFNILQNNNIKTVVIGGNHDFDNSNYITKTHPFKNIDKYSNITFVYKDYKIIEFDDLILSIVPHQPIISNKEKELDIKINSSDKIWRDIIKTNKNSTKKRLLLTHGIIESWVDRFSNRQINGEIQENNLVESFIVKNTVAEEFDIIVIGHTHSPFTQKIGTDRGSSYRIVPGSIVENKFDFDSESNLKGTGPIYLNTETLEIKRHNIDSVKYIKEIFNNKNELELFLDNIKFNIYSLLYNGKLEDIRKDLYYKAINKSLYLNIQIKNNINYNKNNNDISSIKDFWSWLSDTYPTKIKEFKDIIKEEK